MYGVSAYHFKLGIFFPPVADQCHTWLKRDINDRTEKQVNHRMSSRCTLRQLQLYPCFSLAAANAATLVLKSEA
jgi:hypothetical protein